MADEIPLLPLPAGGGLLVQYQRYLTRAAEDELKQLVQHVRGHTLTFAIAALGLGRISGYYDLLAEIARQARVQAERG